MECTACVISNCGTCYFEGLTARCQTCSSGFVRSADWTSCVQSPPVCATNSITNGVLICSACSGTKYLYNGDCIDSCPVGTWKNGNVCSKCNPSCASCTSATTCTECSPGFVTNNPGASPPTCQPSCSSNQFKDYVSFTSPYTKCTDCHNSCSTCS
jgi:hypothetical protein